MQSWIQITSGGQGTGNGSFVYTLRPNYGTNARSGSIRVEERTFAISQAADDGTTPPSITQQPVPQSIRLGGTATLTVAAVGSEPLGYHWRRNGVPVPGAVNTPSLVLSNVALAAAGNYSVLVSNRAGVTASQAATLTVREQTPFNGSPWNIPGTIQAEHFDQGGSEIGFVDRDAGNQGGAFRSDTDVDIITCADANGGFCVTQPANGERLDYTVNVAETGLYLIEVRAASSTAGDSFHLEFNGVNVTGSIPVPNTGGAQTWRNIRRPVSGANSPLIHLTAGRQVMRLVWERVTRSVSTLVLPVPALASTHAECPGVVASRWASVASVRASSPSLTLRLRPRSTTRPSARGAHSR
jgi:hypothetical protein